MIISNELKRLLFDNIKDAKVKDIILKYDKNITNVKPKNDQTFDIDMYGELIDFDDSDNSDDSDERDIALMLTDEYKIFSSTVELFFEKLCDNDILAVSDNTCCDSCGLDKIREIKEIIEEENGVSSFIGYVFYTEDDINTIIDDIEMDKNVCSIGLSWNYFKIPSSDRTSKKLAEKIKNIGKEYGIDIQFVNNNTKLIMTINLK